MPRSEPNFLRSCDLSESLMVLELGGRAGPIVRHLAEANAMADIDTQVVARIEGVLVGALD